MSFRTISGGKPLSINWHHEAILWQLERVRRGETTRLIVTMPPRNLKSITINVAWVALMLGIDPSLRFVCVSYSADLARKHAVEARGQFDRVAAIALALEPALRTGEALRDDVWAFLTAVLAPDVVAWRFPDRAAHRYAGGVRNAFQRLWARGTVLDRGEGHADRWGLVEALSEDAMVQIFERASLAGNERLARAIAELWVETAADVGRGAMESVMRRATKLVRIRNEIIDLAILPDANLLEEVRGCFRRAVRFAPEEEQLKAG